ncbi:hypothetical protein L9F63_019634, partial [Diploptera punctata]
YTVVRNQTNMAAYQFNVFLMLLLTLLLQQKFVNGAIKGVLNTEPAFQEQESIKERPSAVLTTEPAIEHQTIRTPEVETESHPNSECGYVYEKYSYRTSDDPENHKWGSRKLP